VRVASTDGHVEIAVADTGPGIARGALKKIFDDFYRVEDALTRSTGGTGIGLALVRKFMSAMGGTVSAANNKGPGCTITLRLPHS
jgi:signal transduction histidine kinase